MTNEELSKAIERIARLIMDEDVSDSVRSLLEEHLKALLSEQARRAEERSAPIVYQPVIVPQWPQWSPAPPPWQLPYW